MQFVVLMCKMVQVWLDVVVMFCMNLYVVYLVGLFEQVMGIVVYDMVLMVVWKVLWMVGVDMGVLVWWGKLFLMS